MRRVLLALAVLLLGSSPSPAGTLQAQAGPPPVDVILRRVFTDPNPEVYEVTSDFEGTAVITWKGGRVRARAAGNLREFRATVGGPRRREVTITTLDLPLVLQPFNRGIKNLIAERITREEGTLGLMELYDVFITGDLPGGRFVIGGVRADIVTEIMERYGRTGEAKDVMVRREVARWLYQPRQREMVVRGGGPYLITLVADEQGFYYRLLLQYDWGPVETQLDWGTSAGRQVWREVKMDASTDVRGLGHVEGRMNLRFSNWCYNCKK